MTKDQLVAAELAIAKKMPGWKISRGGILMDPTPEYGIQSLHVYCHYTQTRIVFDWDKMDIVEEKKKTRTGINDEQWAMPVGVDPNGNFVSLKAYTVGVDLAIPTEQQDIDIFVERISMQKDYELSTYGGYTKKEAIDNIKRKTPFGKRIMDIERRVMLHAMKVEHG